MSMSGGGAERGNQQCALAAANTPLHNEGILLVRITLYTNTPNTPIHPHASVSIQRTVVKGNVDTFTKVMLIIDRNFLLWEGK